MADQQEAWRRGGSSQRGAEMRSVTGSVTADKAFTELRATVFKITNDVFRMRQMVTQIGTAKDTKAFRTELHSMDKRIQDQVAKAKVQSARLQEIRETLSAEKTRSWHRVTEDLKARLEEYREVMEWRKQKESEHMPIAEKDESTPLLGGGPSRSQAQKQIELENQIEYQEAIVEENEQAIVDIVAAINEVHQITQDIGVLVSDQGQMLGDLELNIGNMAKRTDGALQEIETAEVAQKKNRNIWCWVFILVAIVFVVLVVALLALQ